MNRRIKQWVVITVFLCLAVALAVFGYSLIWGKLFPFTPLVVGFEKTELSRVDVYIESGYSCPNYTWIDSVVTGVEAFHELQFRSRPRIFMFGDRETYAHRSLSKARLCAFFNGDVVVSPWAQEEDARGDISLRVYMTHELSHSLLFQNMSLMSCLEYPRWLLEGIATYSAHQMGTTFYPDRAETLEAVRQGNWMPPFDFDTPAGDSIALSVKYPMPFVYSEFALIVSDLIDSHGRDTFLRYMKQLMTDDDHAGVFRDVFGVDFEAYLTGLRERMETEDYS